MILLAIDTSGSGCYAAIHDSDKNATLGVAGEEIGRGHAERLMDFVDTALERAGVGLSDVERIAVTIGPGSFTGIRVGVAAARGLSLALGIPAVGVSTLAAIAAGYRCDHPAVPTFVAIDAKRGEVYCQTFAADGAPMTAPMILPVEEARSMAEAFQGEVIGSAAPLLAGRDAESEPRAVPIEAVVRLGMLADPAADKPKPLYLRGPDAKPQAGFAIARA